MSGVACERCRGDGREAECLCGQPSPHPPTTECRVVVFGDCSACHGSGVGS